MEGPAIRLLFFVGGLSFFLILETLNPYRPSTVSKLKRWLTNIGLTSFNNLIIYLIFSGAIAGTIRYTTTHRVGILNAFDAPSWIKILATVAFLDFMLYVWHLLTHKVPILWRFHRVHHSDLNMDVSTGTRFHTGELAMSALIRIGLLFILGASATGVLIFETAATVSIQFHHSSLKVPKGLEMVLWRLFVPPSMHRIHHSVVIKERDTNYGALFSIWDRMLGTLLTEVDQDRIRIGMGAYRRPERLNIHHLLVMPFTRRVR